MTPSFLLSCHVHASVMQASYKCHASVMQRAGVMQLSWKCHACVMQLSGHVQVSCMFHARVLRILQDTCMDSLTVCMAHGVRAACSHSGLKLSVIRHCWGVQCVMSLRCIIDRAACSQCDIDQSRPPGSSCCTLFCSRLAVNVLGRASPSTDFFSMSSLQELLLKAVRDWDRTNLVDGAPAHQVLLDCSRESSGFELDIEVQERFVSRCGLLDILATSGSGDFAILLTAIPETDGEHQQKCGKTCALFSLRDAVHLVDSHPRHPCGGGPAGMLHAYVEDSQVDLRSKVLCDWIWANDGFLKELRCNFDFVDITVFRNKRRTQAPTLTSPLRLSGRVSSSNSSGATSSQELVTPSRPTEPTSSTSGQAQYTPPPMQIIAEIDNHDQIHPTFVKDCARCRWRRTAALEATVLLQTSNNRAARLANHGETSQYARILGNWLRIVCKPCVFQPSAFLLWSLKRVRPIRSEHPGYFARHGNPSPLRQRFSQISFESLG